MRKFCAAVLFLGMTHAAAAQQTVEVPTYSPSDYTEILNGRYKKEAARITGELYMPSGVAGRVPAVVVMHGSGGTQEHDRLVAEALQKSGMAALVLDSFTGRGLSSTGQDQGKLSMAASVLDGFQALVALRQQPAIDGSRIGIVGFSRGGVAAMFSNEEPLRKAVLGDNPGFRAHAPAYPGCSTQWENVRPTRAPVLFLLGEKDDLTPSAKCLSLADRINKAGGLAQTIVYPGVSHNFLTPGQTVNSGSQNYGVCDMTITDSGEMSYPKLGIRVDGDWPGFVRKVFADCGTKGYTSGGTAESRDRVVADITAFFQRTLR